MGDDRPCPDDVDIWMLLAKRTYWGNFFIAHTHSYVVYVPSIQQVSCSTAPEMREETAQ